MVIVHLTDGPIITEEELTSLPLVKVVPDGQYTGLKLSSVVRMMRGLLDQKIPLQEFEVTIFKTKFQCYEACPFLLHMFTFLESTKSSTTR